MLLIFTFLHPVVDALSASVLWIGATGITSFIVYNFCSFALQLPLGIVLDIWPQMLKEALIVGLVLLVGGGLSALCGVATLPVICTCCVGNALFHLAAGKLILDRTDGRSGPVACFISTGALGLLVAKMFAVPYSAVLIPVLATTLLAGGSAAMRLVQFAGRHPYRFHRLPAVNWCMMVVLFVLVIGRSWVVLSNGTIGSAVSLLLIGALVSLAGQVAGGSLADRVGRAPIVTLSLAGSLLLYLGIGLETPIVWFAILFLAQMATGPVLSLITSSLDKASGTSFGLNCLGLFVGIF